MKKTVKYFYAALALVFLLLGTACQGETGLDTNSNSVNYAELSVPAVPEQPVITLDTVPPYSGSPAIQIEGNRPRFKSKEKTTKAFETYSPLDDLGRCGVAFANVCKEIMPTEERGAIGAVKPSGWHTVRYDDLIDGKYLYNRCHLIGFQLAGENANPENLITGTRYLNVEGMLPYENMVADYVRKTGNHVLYRSTPIFKENNLVASGVQLEAYSVEDSGQGVSFNVYVYNVQPCIEIDYATGESHSLAYIVNTNSLVFHRADCKIGEKVSGKNRMSFTGTRDEAVEKGYKPCGVCKP